MRIQTASSIAVSVIAIAVAGLVAPSAHGSLPGATDSAGPPESAQAAGAVASDPQATLPLHWVVPSARKYTTGHTSCSTAVTVILSPDLPEATTLATVEVEWFDHAGGSMGVSTYPTVHPGYRITFVTDRRVMPPFDVANINAGLRDFTGYARVHSDESDLHVSAQTYCRKGTRRNAPLVASHSIAAIKQ